MTFTCENCGGEYRRKPSRAAETKYCSYRCKGVGSRTGERPASELVALLDAMTMPIPFCGCFVWLGETDGAGYGRIQVEGRANGRKRTMPVHRLSYELHHGIHVPAKLVMDHLCRVKLCRNPDHLEPVTTTVNYLRGVRKSRITHCRKGHEFTPENTIGTASHRRCRACQRQASRDHRLGLRLQHERGHHTE